MQQQRHSAQITLPEIGTTGQQRLATTHILIVGLGALGSTAAELCCRAGIQHLTLCDDDIITESNLQRQSLYTTNDIGTLKVQAAQQHLTDIDNTCTITTITEPFNATTPLAHINLVIDGTDSLPARLLLNDACKKANIPLIIGTATRTTGYTYVVNNTPCWQCITVDKTTTDNCDTGVLGPTTHAIASLQVSLALRTLLDKPPTELLQLDVWNMTLRKINVTTNPHCKACNQEYVHLTAPYTIDYCSINDKLIVRPNKPRKLDLEQLKTTEHVIQSYPAGLLIQLGNGNVLIHRYGSLEFDAVDPILAKQYAQRLLGT